jgi:hypothetical protein
LFFNTLGLRATSPWWTLDYDRRFRYPEEPLFIDSIFGQDGRVYRWKLGKQGVEILRFDRAGKPLPFAATGTNALFVDYPMQVGFWHDVYPSLDVDRHGIRGLWYDVGCPNATPRAVSSQRGPVPMIDDEYQPYDRSSKWLIQHHGDSMLWLAQIKDLEAWRPAQAQVVQPTQIPDGLLEARRRGQPRDDLVLLEAATYPERRLVRQMTRDMMLVYLDRSELPEAVALVLRPKGTYRVPAGRNLRSRGGLSSCRLKWRVVELWTIPAEELLRAQDVGLIPWVPLTAFADPPETMLRRCRDAIEQQAPPDEKANLLAIGQVFTFLRYNDEGLLTILGGKDAMLKLKVPFLDEIVKEKTQEAVRAAEEAVRAAEEAAREVAQEAARVAAREAVRENLVTVLEARFGNVPRDLTDEIGSIGDAKQLKSLVRSAVACPDLDAFRDALARR